MLEDLELEKRKCPDCGSETYQTNPDEDDPKED
jgi:rRNA maturation protein Nop10